jgi:hypothetical protein
MAEIHARWLMTPRDDLGGRAPRDVLLEKRHHLEWDLEDRCLQWSFTGACPPALSETSAAFRHGGFGTHENLLYYDLVRHLVWSGWRRVVQPVPGAPAAAESPAELSAWLCQVQEAWLGEPDWEDLSGRTPAEVVRMERQRIPMTAGHGEAIIDDDCPLCQMAAEFSGPMFWHLDGCNNDDDFPFSVYCRTRQEWENERRRREEFERDFEEQQQRRREVMQAGLPGNDEGAGESIWQRSFVDARVDDTGPWMRLFAIGCRLAELDVDVKTSPDTAGFVKSLGRHFGNLRSAVDAPSPALLEPVTERFRQELHELAEVRPDLAAKCADLDRELRELAAALDPDIDAPF